MRRLLPIAALLLAACAPAFGQANEKKADPAKADLDKLKGTWVASSVTVDGREAPGEETSKVKVTFEGDKYTVREGENEVESGKIKVDGSKTPKQIDATSETGAGQGRTLKGIFKVEGETMTMCFGEPDKDRPTEFSSAEGSGLILMVYKRDKP